ncbi:MAG: protein kinase [Acidobacteria bacterium]|nr:protein kinase [Acidobacteriota bacterium]MCA1636971.1 protein kinase [Acidobacteriota bacterium]
MTIAAHTKLGRYEILSPIGAGGMGEVYLAEDIRLNRKVALKILPENIATDKERLLRFEREAQAASALNHPNIITIHEIGETGDQLFIATEYIEGDTLRQKIEKNDLDVYETVRISEQIAAALSVAHQAHIIHRDIKPENIMIRRDGYVKILDFGLAKLIEKKSEIFDAEGETRAQVNTKAGMIMGTVGYMSPEQARGKDIDERTDVWSLGVCLYEMLTGRQPFTGETTSDTIAAILTKEPLPLDENLPSDLQRIVRKTLQKGADKRYQTAKDLLIDLEDVKEELKFQSKLERTSPPNREESKTQILNATITDVAHTTSNAEYVVSEIKSHKIGFAIGLMVLLLASIGLGYWYFAGRSTKQIESIAVLPFVNESGNADNEYLSDGMTESLIGSLSQIPKLNVKARASVFRYKGKEIDPKRIGQELSVQAILTGRVVQRGNDLTLYVELIDAASENVLWKADYNRSMNNLVSLQSDVAKDVSNKLKTKLSGAQEQQVAKTYTENPEAYQLYLKGLYHWNKRTPDDLKQAISLFQQAVDKDPAYAKAYGGLAMAYEVYSDNAPLTRQEDREIRLKAKAAALKALELDNNLPEAYAVLAEAKIDDWNFDGAENHYKRAIELNPNFATARQWYSELLARLERRDEAIAEIKRAYEIDPFSRAVNLNLGLRYWESRRNDEAMAQFKKLIETEPTYPLPYAFLAGMYAEKGMYEESIELSCKGEVLLNIETAKSCEQKVTDFRQAIKTSGATGFWRKTLENDLKRYEQGIGSAVYVAADYARLGEKERAFEWLEKAFAEHDDAITFLKVDTSFDSLKSDPRFQDLLRRIGLPQ